MKYSREPAAAFSKKDEERVKYLKQFRREHQMTQTDLADFTNTSARTVEGWEYRGKVPEVVTALLGRIEEMEYKIGLYFDKF